MLMLCLLIIRAYFPIPREVDSSKIPAFVVSYLKLQRVFCFFFFLKRRPVVSKSKHKSRQHMEAWVNCLCLSQPYGGKITSSTPSSLILAFLSVTMWVKGREGGEGKSFCCHLKSMEANDRAVVSTVGCNDQEMRSLHSHYSVPQI